MKKKTLQPIEDRGPLRAMFALTSMPVGGAETLLMNLVENLNRDRIAPEICCLKEKGALGERLDNSIPVHERLLSHKYDVRVLHRLMRLLKNRRIDALITVGAGDKMFWGRLAARGARLPVIVSALHSTGWPDGVGRLNRLLTPITDAFIAVAREHQTYLSTVERLPADRVYFIPNGVDTHCFRKSNDTHKLRRELNIPINAPVVGLVAALRPEKNHAMFLEMARRVLAETPEARFLIVGDGPESPKLQSIARTLGVADRVHFCGTRQDIPEILSQMNVFALTSRNEANPVSILEAMSVGLPIVATDVGSIRETVREGESGFLVPPDSVDALTSRVLELLADPPRADRFGQAGRQIVEESWSLDAMVRGYEELITSIYAQKASPAPAGLPTQSLARYDENLDVCKPQA